MPIVLTKSHLYVDINDNKSSSERETDQIFTIGYRNEPIAVRIYINDECKMA